MKKIDIEKYHHALDRIWDLYKAGVLEQKELENEISLLKDELHRIKALCNQQSGSNQASYLKTMLSEIEGICDRGLSI